MILQCFRRSFECSSYSSCFLPQPSLFSGHCFGIKVSAPRMTSVTRVTWMAGETRMTSVAWVTSVTRMTGVTKMTRMTRMTSVA